MLNFISTAVAQEATNNASAGFSFINFVPIVLIFVVFYLFIIRPQSKKMQEHKQMLDGLKVGAKVITNSGIIGKIKQIKEQEITLEIAENIEIIILRDYILQPKDKAEVAVANVKENKKSHKHQNKK
jgi:preprotein translocase subunit YajC